MKRIAYLASIILAPLLTACGGSPGSNAPGPDGGISTVDATSGSLHAGDVVDHRTIDNSFRWTVSADDDLYQEQQTITNLQTADTVYSYGFAAPGTVNQGTVLVTEVQSQQVASPPTWCRLDVTTKALDASFGTNGCVSGPQDYVGSAAVVRTPHGYVALVDQNCSNGCPAGEDSFGIMHISASGVIDTSIGDNGVLYSTLKPGISAVDAASQSDGKLVVSAYTGVYDMLLLRINDDGTLDTTFGTNGYVTGANGGALRVLADDTIVMRSTYNGTMTIDRFDADGAPLPGFGVNGHADMELLTASTFESDVQTVGLDVDSSGRIVVAYSRHETANGPAISHVLRLNKAGALDESFGSGGIVSDFGNPAYTSISGVGFDHDDKIIVGIFDGNESNLAVRLQP